MKKVRKKEKNKGKKRKKPKIQKTKGEIQIKFDKLSQNMYT